MLQIKKQTYQSKRLSLLQKMVTDPARTEVRIDLPSSERFVKVEGMIGNTVIAVAGTSHKLSPKQQRQNHSSQTKRQRKVLRIH